MYQCYLFQTPVFHDNFICVSMYTISKNRHHITHSVCVNLDILVFLEYPRSMLAWTWVKRKRQLSFGKSSSNITSLL